MWKRNGRNGSYGPIRESAEIEVAEWPGFWEYRPSSSVGAGNPSFRIRSKPTVEYDGSQLSEFQVDSLMFSTFQFSKQVAFNSRKLVGQVLYIYQSSIAASQKITDSIIPFTSDT